VVYRFTFPSELLRSLLVYLRSSILECTTLLNRLSAPEVLSETYVDCVERDALPDDDEGESSWAVEYPCFLVVGWQIVGYRI
jgi:hypothetical protein